MIMNTPVENERRYSAQINPGKISGSTGLEIGHRRSIDR